MAGNRRSIALAVATALIGLSCALRSTGGTLRTGTKLLEASEQERSGYALYTYLILPHAPADAEVRARMIAAIEGYLSENSLADAARFDAADSLNVWYLPVKGRTRCAADISGRVNCLLDDYDHARASFVLAEVHGGSSSGPFLISSRVPVVGPVTGGYLLQDMTGVNPLAMKAWIQRYIQLAEARKTGVVHWGGWANELRNAFDLLARGYGEAVPAALALVPSEGPGDEK